MARCVNILHLTDLHLRGKADLNQRVVLKGAETSIAALKGTSRQPDLIVFSGDLANSADDADAYDSVLSLLLKIAATVDLSEERIVICPGNHDVSRLAVGPHLPDVQAWQQLAETRDGSEEVYRDPKFAVHVRRAFLDYSNLASEFARAAHIASGLGFSTFYFREFNIAFAVFNTATLSTAGLIKDFKDDGKLTLPQSILDEAFSNLPTGAHVIAVGHHPLANLNEGIRTTVTGIIANGASAYLSGHLHEVNPNHVFSLAGECFLGQSGALYEWRDYWNGYAVYQVFPGAPHVRANYFRWFEKRRSFSKAEDIADDGIAFSTPAAREFFKDVQVAVDRHALEKWRTNWLLPYLTEECNRTLAPVPIASTFVPPEFTRERIGTDKIGSLFPTKENVTFSQIVEGNSNVLISAPRQSGKTTTIRQWALRLAGSTSLEDRWTAPVLLEFGRLREYPAFIETRVSERLSQLPNGLTAKRLLSQGLVTLLVDEVDFKDHQRLKALREFMEIYPSCRYVFTSSSVMIDSTAWEPVIAAELPLSHVRLRPMKRKHLLSLIEGHGVADPIKADQLLERVTREAKSLNVPLTAVTSSFLIQVFSSEPDRVLVNQATLIERYVELLLQKFSRPDIELRSFDFKLKRDLLGVIAERMTLERDTSPPENEVLKWVIEYIELYGFPQQASQIVEHFIGCRVLERVFVPKGTEICFSLTAFLQYFAAFRMTESPEFRAWIMDNERYLYFSEEVSFYSALARNDRAVLDLVFSELDALASEMWVNASDDVKSGTFMDSLQEQNPAASEEEVFAITEIVRSNAETDEERRQLAESPAGPLVANQKVNRPDFKTVGDRWFAHLILASLTLKHMELIPDALKRDYLRKAITSWLQFNAFSLSLVPQLARDKTITMNGIVYRLNMLTDEPIGELARRISLAMPLAVSHLATGFIGSEKLKRQLQDGIGDRDVSPSIQLLRTLLLADIGVDEIADILAAASEGLQGHRFLLQVLLRKLYDVAIRFRLDDKSIEKVRDLAGRLSVGLEGKKGTKLEGAHLSNVKNKLRQYRLVSTIKEVN